MSAVHGNPHWPVIASTLTKTSRLLGEFYPTTYCKDYLRVSGISYLIGDIFDVLQKTFDATIEKRLDQMPSAINIACVFTEKAVQKAIQTAAASIAQKASAKDPADEKENGAKAESFLDLLTVASKIVSLYFSLKEPQVIILPLYFSIWKTETSTKLIQFTYQSLGVKSDDQPLYFTAEDLQFFGVQASEIALDLEKLSCVCFAFLKIREERAKGLIFHSPVEQAQAIRDLPAILHAWDYRSVAFPDAGDLVVYLQDDIVTHAGIFLESGLVRSKFGIDNPYEYRHNLFDIPPGYGNQVVFFRRSRFTY